MFEARVPDARLSVLGTSNDVLAIGRDSAAYHQVFAVRAKESFLDSDSTRGLILDQSDAVIPGLHEDLVCKLWMNFQIVDLIAF